MLDNILFWRRLLHRPLPPVYRQLEHGLHGGTVICQTNEAGKFERRMVEDQDRDLKNC
jgi:hypothetical protein